ncbi:DUF6479 family protein [Streptacidiphilus sp. PAMC 29251]
MFEMASGFTEAGALGGGVVVGVIVVGVLILAFILGARRKEREPSPDGILLPPRDAVAALIEPPGLRPEVGLLGPVDGSAP